MLDTTNITTWCKSAFGRFFGNLRSVCYLCSLQHWLGCISLSSYPNLMVSDVLESLLQTLVAICINHTLCRDSSDVTVSPLLSYLCQWHHIMWLYVHFDPTGCSCHVHLLICYYLQTSSSRLASTWWEKRRSSELPWPGLASEGILHQFIHECGYITPGYLP